MTDVNKTVVSLVYSQKPTLRAEYLLQRQSPADDGSRLSESDWRLKLAAAS